MSAQRIVVGLALGLGLSAGAGCPSEAPRDTRAVGAPAPVPGSATPRPDGAPNTAASNTAASNTAAPAPAPAASPVAPVAAPHPDAITEIFEEPAPVGPGGVPVGQEPEAAFELEALRHDLTFPRGLFFPLVVILAWAATRAIQRGARFVLHLGIKRRRLVSTGAALLSLAMWALAIALILGRLLRAAPTLTLGVLTLASVASVLVLRHQLESLAAGVSLAVRDRLREGDRIAVGEFNGVVRRVGFTRVELHQADGSRLFIPNRIISTESVAIGPARYSVPLQISLGRDRPWGAEEIHHARQIAALSPYRDPSGRIVVEAREGEQHLLLVQLQVWSPRLVTTAEQHLRRQLDRHVAHRPGFGSRGERRQGERRSLERRGL